LHARTVLLAASDQQNEQSQAILRVSKLVVIKWRGRFVARRLEGLRDEAGRRRKRKYDADIRHSLRPRGTRSDAGEAQP
jgi:hypothetical protein